MHLPEWREPASAAEARATQKELRHKLVIRDDFQKLEMIGGVDVGYDNKRGLAHASLVVMRLDELTPYIQHQVFVPVRFPYIPGLLAFREIPAILKVLRVLDAMPDVLMVDGHGIAHPKRMGIAAHLGVLLDIPTIGVAKSLLTGNYTMPDETKGSTSPLYDRQGEQIGVVLRSREKVKPLFISPGNRVSMETALSLVQQCLTKYRLPEPTRLADKYSKCSDNSSL